MAEQKRATLSDVINYVPEQYLSGEEISIIQSTFKGVGGEKLIKIFRKVLMPTILDPELPIEEINSDSWLVNIDFANMQTDELKPIVLARQDALKFLLGGLIKLKIIANQTQESEAERNARRAQDSTK